MTVMIQSLILIIPEAAGCRIFLDTFLPKKDLLRQCTERIGNIGMILLLELIAVFLAERHFMKVICVITVITGMAHIVFKGRVIHKLFLATLFYGIVVSFDFLFFIFLRRFLPELYDDVFASVIHSTYMSLFCKVLLLFLILFIRLIWNKKYNINIFSYWELFQLSYFPIQTTVISFMMMQGFDKNDKIKNAVFILACCFNVMNFVVVCLMRNMLNKKVEVRETRLQQEKNKMIMDTYRTLKEVCTRQKENAHDYVHHFDYLQGMMTKGNSEKAMQYISDLAGEIYKGFDMIQTNNIVVDTVINQKYRYAKSKGISLVTVLSDLSDVLMKEEDLVIVLSNLLDNAIEACEKLEKDKKIIFKFMNEKDELLMYVENPIDKPLKIINNKIASTKEYGHNHGFGMLNICSAIEKYDGISTFQCENGKFCFSALIPNVEIN